MVKFDDPRALDGIRSKAHALKFGHRWRADQPPVLPISNAVVSDDGENPGSGFTTLDSDSKSTSKAGAEAATSSMPPPAPPPTSEKGAGDSSTAIEMQHKHNVVTRFYHTCKEILFSSIMNTMLVFVPVGIALNYTGVNPSIVFAINAIAIIPLAGLLSHATETVAASLGDTVGALLNVTFGNAVELIIFVALVKDEIRIVQASLVGSILSNLLLILGMSFLFGGLRFREQLYNSTVTQMSACLLSLSVTSLLLPTAFHASFSDSADADFKVLQISRGSSIILLLIYVLYLLFQLKSHAYMYESTPQHIIDEESHPGVLAEILNSSTSDESGTTDSDSDTSSGSQTTAKRIRRALRGRRRRKSSLSSKDVPSVPSVARRSPSTLTSNDVAATGPSYESTTRHQLGAVASGDEADTDGEHESGGLRNQSSTVQSRDFEIERFPIVLKSLETKPKRKSKKRHHCKHCISCEKQREKQQAQAQAQAQNNLYNRADELVETLEPHVSFVPDTRASHAGSSKRPLTIRGLSVRPAMPKVLTSTVFSSTNATGAATTTQTPITVPRAPYGLRRTSSLPDRLHNSHQAAPAQPMQRSVPVNANTDDTITHSDDSPKKHMSRTSAVILLLISTGLVAICAECLVGSINYLVAHSSVTQAFVGLIILPIVGNAAEHVTAVTVASKNKMDLAIGVAVGSSIQIALFVTPIVVLLGWILGKGMSLYFDLFETVSLFVSAFIVNFLVLDGRSNYLEGALLMAAYTIIAVAAFFYPNCDASAGAASSAACRPAS